MDDATDQSGSTSLPSSSVGAAQGAAAPIPADRARAPEPAKSRAAPRRRARPLPPGWRWVQVPWRGRVVVGPEHRQRVDDFFRVPMIVLAILVLPLLALEHWASETLTHVPALGYAATGALALIWLAFLVEFTVKVAIADSRWGYVQRNWLDVIVLILPFLRLLRVVSAFRAMTVMKLAQGMTLRGVFLKFARGVVGFLLGAEAVRRLFGIRRHDGPAEARERDRLQRLSRKQLIEEVIQLQRRHAEVCAELLAENGVSPHRERRNDPDAPPTVES